MKAIFEWFIEMFAEYMIVLFILNNKMGYLEISTSLRVTDSELHLFFPVRFPFPTQPTNHFHS